MKYSAKEKWVLLLLATGVCFFGMAFPESFSSHLQLVHFAAHFGMSFLLALCFYMVCTVKLRFSKIFSYSTLILATLFIGIGYKYWEMASQGMFNRFSFLSALKLAGVTKSMSQNLSGLFAAVLLIESLVARNLVIDVMKYSKRISHAVEYKKTA